MFGQIGFRNLILIFCTQVSYQNALEYQHEQTAKLFAIFGPRKLGPKRDGVTGEWRKLHNEELNSLYSSPNILRVIKSRRLRWTGHVVRMEEGRGVHKFLVGKPEVKRPLGRPRRRWEDNIKTDLEEVGRGCGDWMELAEDRDRWRALVSTVMNSVVP